MPYFGLRELDKMIEPFVDFDGGVFFEAGANDGLAQSNTAHFEKDRGWTGILVEPATHRLEQAKTNRPKSRCFNAALVAPDYPLATVPMQYCNLMTTTCDPQSITDPKRHTEIGLAILRRGKEEPFEFSAAARTISSILDECSIQRIDLMSIDLEGYEHVALRGLDHSRHYVKFLCVEARVPSLVTEALGPLFQQRQQISHQDYIFERIG